VSRIVQTTLRVEVVREMSDELVAEAAARGAAAYLRDMGALDNKKTGLECVRVVNLPFVKIETPTKSDRFWRSAKGAKLDLASVVNWESDLEPGKPHAVFLTLASGAKVWLACKEDELEAFDKAWRAAREAWA
jgi:hypothetical protein